MLTWLGMDQKEVLHSIRTAVAALGSLLIARFCRLPESYWAAHYHRHYHMQSTLGAAWTVSKQRFVGTALGAAFGALLTAYAAQNAAALGTGVFVLGLTNRYSFFLALPQITRMLPARQWRSARLKATARSTAATTLPKE